MSRQAVLALAAGKMPAGIEPDSAQGRIYSAMLEELARLRALSDAQPLSDAQIARVVELLRT